MTLVEIFALNVRRLRNSKGWSQEELADRVKLSRVYVSYIENGRQAASLEIVERVAKAFGVEPTKLLERPLKSARA